MTRGPGSSLVGCVHTEKNVLEVYDSDDRGSHHNSSSGSSDCSNQVTSEPLHLSRERPSSPVIIQSIYYNGHTLTPMDHNGNRVFLPLVVEDIVLSVRCGVMNRDNVFSHIHHLLPRLKSDTIMASMARLIVHDAELAYQLYDLCNHDEHIQIDDSSIFALAISLASQGLVKLAIPFLSDPRLSQYHVQELIHAVILSLTRNRDQYVDTRLLTNLGDAMLLSFKTSPPSLVSRSLIERTVFLIAVSGDVSNAIAIIDVVHKSSPSYFTATFLRRFLRQIASQRHFRLAIRLFTLVAVSHPEHAVQWRRSLILDLARGGASALVHKLGQSVTSCPSGIESLARVADFRLGSPPQALEVMSIAMKHPSDGPTIQFAMQILIQAKRFLEAKRLFDQTQHNLDKKTQTILGNMILHTAFFQPSLRNGRQVRNILMTLDHLVKKYDFVPDRVTANTLLKAILRWNSELDCSKLRALFDYIVNLDYPGCSLLRDGELPFNTSGALPPDLNFSNLPPFISFGRHVRPMYKMFIKAFFVRGDKLSARTVIGILHAAELAEQERREKRYMSRLKGTEKEIEVTPNAVQSAAKLDQPNST